MHLSLLSIPIYCSFLSEAFIPSSRGPKVGNLSFERRHNHLPSTSFVLLPLRSTSQEDDVDDNKLLKEVKKTQLQDLCKQFDISTEGTKEVLIARLRQYAEDQAKIEQERQVKRIQRIEQGVDDTQGNGKAKHRVVESTVDNDNENENELEGSFYFSIPGGVDNKKSSDEGKNQHSKVTISSTNIMNPQNAPMNTITAPIPPPDLPPNEDGERVVTVYSTQDQNDLTGLAAQNSATSANDAAMMGGYSRADTMGKAPENTLAGGPFGDQSGTKRKKASDKEYEDACEIITELVLSLVQMTGAPGFQDEFTEGVVSLEDVKDRQLSNHGNGDNNNGRTDRNANTDFGFIGFDPSRVPIGMVTNASKNIRVRNGDALRSVLHDFEMQAIGYDGMAGDDKEKGGGHYLEVQKVGTFLEGFRKAEVRRIARETSTMLLDKLVTEGVKSLDQMLITMTKGSDDSSEAGELNDSLIDYLEDAVRQQKNKVKQLLGEQGVKECEVNTVNGVEQGVLTDGLSDSFWNSTLTEEGEVVESFDPNDPDVKAALERELKSAQEKMKEKRTSMPPHPSQQLLVLLNLLKERVKAEAVFTNDEKGRNLRILAYSLHAGTEKEREQVIMDNLGSSLDVSFMLLHY